MGRINTCDAAIRRNQLSCEPNMTNQAETTLESGDAFLESPLDEGFESIGDHHRAAAHHFTAAAKHHMAAALADDEGNEELADRHSYLAYRHRLNGAQYAEIAVMDSESLEDVIESNV
jgi:hypothetical protein